LTRLLVECSTTQQTGQSTDLYCGGLDDVTPELLALDGERVTITGRDMVKDRLNMADGVIVLVPEWFAKARRARDDD
jgi:hypothetical protein